MQTRSLIVDGKRVKMSPMSVDHPKSNIQVTVEDMFNARVHYGHKVSMENLFSGLLPTKISI
jgi:hypothetical protein